MATKPLTREEIANTEKKLDMPLDDIIKMSKNSTTTKGNKQQRASNKSLRTFNNAAQDRALKVRHYMNSRPFVRQGFLAQRRSNFQGNQFPVATEVARKAAVAPFRNRPFNRNVVINSNKARVGSFAVQRRASNGGFAAKSSQGQHHHQRQGDGAAAAAATTTTTTTKRPQTLDARFAHINEQRMRVFSGQKNAAPRNGSNGRPRVPWVRGRFGN